MFADPKYLRDERRLIRIVAAAGLAFGVLAVFLAWISGERSEPDQLPSVAVWQFISEHAPRAGLDPEFVYAIAWAESSLDPRAETSVARGIMQLTRVAWEEVSDQPYRLAWKWEVNLQVALDYLVFCKRFLERHDSFSYPMLAAAYRYGPYHVKERAFDLDALETPKNRIYRAILEGNVRPVEPPQ